MHPPGYSYSLMLYAHAGSGRCRGPQAEGEKAEEAVDGGGCVVCLGGHRVVSQQARPWFWKSGWVLVLGCELSLSPDGESMEQSIVPFLALGFETAWRGLEREQRGFVLGLVRRRPTSGGRTNQPVKAGAQDSEGGVDFTVFCLLFRRRRIKEFVCLMRCHACISMLQAGGKTSSCWTDCPLNNRGATPFPAGPGGSDDGHGIDPSRRFQHRHPTSSLFFLTALVNSRPTERVLEPPGSSSADRPSHSVINDYLSAVAQHPPHPIISFHLT